MAGMNAIASNVLIKVIDGGAVDGVPSGGSGTAVSIKAVARNIEKEQFLMAEIETGGIGDVSAFYQPGRYGERFNMDLLVPKTAGAIVITVGNYLYMEFATDTSLTPATGQYLVTRVSFRVTDNQETINSISIVGPAATT
jgi:hypothetical protein